MSLFRGKPPNADQMNQNASRIYLLAFFQAFLVIVPIAVPFFQSKGLSMQEVFTLQAIFGAVIVMTEIPSGYLADLWGRRNTLLLGAIFCGIAHTCLLFVEGFWTLVIFEVCLGIAASLISGADIALLYDTKLALRCTPVEQQRSVGNLFFIRSASEATSAVLCSLLVLWSMDQVVFVQTMVGWLPLVFACMIVEPRMERLSTHGHLENFRRIGRIMNKNAIMRFIVLALAFWSLTTFYIVWLLQKYWENIGISLIWFGYLWAGYAIISGVAGRYTDRVEVALGAPLMLIIVGALPVLGYLGMAWTDSLFSLLFAMIFFIARGFGLVILRDALNRRVPGTYRATINSFASFVFRGAFVVTGPVLGWLLDFWGMEIALYATAAYSAVVLVTIMLPLAVIVSSSQGATRRVVEMVPERVVEKAGC